jgi:hypothetical protein
VDKTIKADKVKKYFYAKVIASFKPSVAIAMAVNNRLQIMRLAKTVLAISYETTDIKNKTENY